jgi:hypothetical protein
MRETIIHLLPFLAIVLSIVVVLRASKASKP